MSRKKKHEPKALIQAIKDLEPDTTLDEVPWPAEPSIRFADYHHAIYCHSNDHDVVVASMENRVVAPSAVFDLSNPISLESLKKEDPFTPQVIRVNVDILSDVVHVLEAMSRSMPTRKGRRLVTITSLGNDKPVVLALDRTRFMLAPCVPEEDDCNE